MSLRTVRCPRCDASVSIYMLNCDVCMAPIAPNITAVAVTENVRNWV